MTAFDDPVTQTTPLWRRPLVRSRPEPGDFIYVPAWVPHREENPSLDEDAVVVLARSTPEEIVVNLASLWPVDGIPGASET